MAALAGLLTANAKEIIHDAEYYILDAQHGERWAVEDKELDAKLAELRKKFGTPPNIIHIMWDDTAVGEVGIPALQKVRGFETPLTVFIATKVRTGLTPAVNALALILIAAAVLGAIAYEVARRRRETASKGEAEA